MLEKIINQVLGDDHLMRDFTALCDTGGRFAGSDSEQAAQDYLSDRLTEITGVKPYHHKVDYLGWSRGNSSLERLDSTGGLLPCVSLVRSPATAADGLVAEVIDLGRGTEQDFDTHAAQIKGRIVLVRHEYMFATDTIHRRRKYQWAMDAGAVGFLIACHLSGVGPVTGSSGATPESGIPAAGISAETAATLIAAGPAKIRFKVEAEQAPRSTSNLILDLPGLSDEWVVLSAHIDGHHLAESAMDNATGLVAVLAIARAMASHVGQLKRGLRIALFTVEEWALAGSKDYVDNMSDVDRSKIKLNLNLDSIAGSPNLTALTSDFPKLEDWLLEHSRAQGRGLGVHRPLMANSDHYNFARHGIPAVRFVVGFNEHDSAIKYLLTAADTRDKIDPQDLRSAAGFVAALTVEACQADELNLNASA